MSLLGKLSDFNNKPQEYFLINIFTIPITVTTKFVISTTNICDLIYKILKAPIPTKSNSKNSIMFPGMFLFIPKITLKILQYSMENSS